MPVSERTYECLALEDPEGQWELYRGELRGKSAMSFGHNVVMRGMYRSLVAQLDPRQYEVSSNASRVRPGTGTFFIPDLCVIPVTLTDA